MQKNRKIALFLRYLWYLFLRRTAQFKVFFVKPEQTVSLRSAQFAGQCTAFHAQIILQLLPIERDVERIRPGRTASAERWGRRRSRMVCGVMWPIFWVITRFLAVVACRRLCKNCRCGSLASMASRHKRSGSRNNTKIGPAAVMPTSSVASSTQAWASANICPGPICARTFLLLHASRRTRLTTSRSTNPSAVTRWPVRRNVYPFSYSFCPALKSRSSIVHWVASNPANIGEVPH